MTIFALQNMKNMELRQLRAFVLAAETKNFSEAAERMCITPSTFSQTIKSLEAELKTDLFVRNSHETFLTEAGEEILPFAQNTLQQAKYCEDRVLDLKNLNCGTLNIGVTHSFKMMASDAIHHFISTYPKIKLMVYYKTMKELLEMLLAGQVDCVLSYRPSVIPSNIESHTLFDDRLSAIVNETHPLASLKEIDLHELACHQLVLPTEGMQARNALTALATRKGISIKPQIEINEVVPLLNLVQSSQMATILSRSSIDGFSDLRAIPIAGSEDMLIGSYHVLRNSYHKHSMKVFVEILCQSSTIRKRMGLI